MDLLSAARDRRRDAHVAFVRAAEEAAASVPSPWPQPQRVRSLADFALGEELGRGSYAVVLRARERLTNASVAVKRVSKAHVARHNKTHEVMREKEALQALLPSSSHSFAETGACEQREDAGESDTSRDETAGGERKREREALVSAAVRLFFTMQDSTHLYFVLELCPRGDLQQQLWRYGSATPVLCRFYARQLAAALLYLHRRDIVHRDIKPDNVLVDAYGRLRLADLAASRRLERHEDGAPERRNSFVGTPEYVAPEVLEALPLTPATDWWGFACVLLRMAAGRPPFAADTDYLMYERIMACDYWLPLPGLDEALADLLRRLLVADPTARPSGPEVLRHAYLRAGVEEAGEENNDVDNVLRQPSPEEPGPFVPALGAPLEMGHLDDALPSPAATDAWQPEPAAEDVSFRVEWHREEDKAAGDTVRKEGQASDASRAEGGEKDRGRPDSGPWLVPDPTRPQAIATLRSQQRGVAPWLPLISDEAAIVLALPAWRRHGLVTPEPVLLILSTDARLHNRARSDPLTMLKDLGTVRLTAACSADAWGAHALLVYTPKRVHYFAMAATAAHGDEATTPASAPSAWEDGGAAPATRMAAAINALVSKCPAQPALEDSHGDTAQDRPVAF